MPTYQRFEDLPVWQEAIVLAERCVDFLDAAKDRITWSKRDQLDRASLSVSSNIADEARQRGAGQCRRHWPEAKRRAACSGRPQGGTGRNGFERGTTSELLAFLYIARGSAGEVRSMLCFFERRPRLRDLKSQISTEATGRQPANLKSIAESCSRQLGAWAQSLQNSDIEGPRHLNDHTRANYQKRKAREQGEAGFQQLLAQHLPPDHPGRRKA